MQQKVARLSATRIDRDISASVRAYTAKKSVTVVLSPLGGFRASCHRFPFLQFNPYIGVHQQILHFSPRLGDIVDPDDEIMDSPIDIDNEVFQLGLLLETESPKGLLGGKLRIHHLGANHVHALGDRVG